MLDIVVEVRTHSSNIVLMILTRKKYKNNSIQEFVTIESWPLIIVYTTNQVCIIPLNFNYKEYTFKEVIHTKKKQKIDGCFLRLFQQILRQNVNWFFS